MKTRPQLTLIMVVVALALIALGVTTAFARVENVIFVNSTDDTFIPGDGKCTLREAINNANNDSNSAPSSSPDCANGFNADIIELGENLDYIMNVIDSGSGADTNGMPVITSNITINGHGSNLIRSLAGGTPEFRIFKINFSGVLTLNDLDMFNGLVQNDGGGLWNDGSLILNNSSIRDSRGNRGGGIFNSEYLELNHSRVEYNITNDGSSSGPTPGFDGGGIYSALESKLEIADSSISNNHTGSGGTSGPDTADDGSGAGIYSLGTFKMTNSTVNNNTAGSGDGGGLYLAGTTALIQDTTISGNFSADGGGIWNGVPEFKLVRSSLSSNEAIRGGGLFGNAESNVFNSTIALNEAMNGGATFTDANSVFSFSTIAQNNTFSDGTVEVNGGQLIINNSIVANNTLSPNCYTGPGTSIINGGKNIDSGTECGFGSANGSLSSTDPKIFALADNGGPTHTMAIAPDSPARDMGDTAVCTNPNGWINNVDQRMFLRIKVPSDLCDVGAYEYNAAPGPVNPTATRTPTITPTNVPPGVTRTETPIPPTPTQTHTPDPCPSAPPATYLISPNHNATVKSNRPALRWGPATCATTYNVTVRFKNTVVDSATGLTVLKYKTDALESGKKYSWSVESCNVHGCSVSVVRKFKVP